MRAPCGPLLDDDTAAIRMLIDMVEEFGQGTRSSVVGLGGGGNAAENMIARSAQG